jgi:putative glycerol-1-phosphate prenyltransferase
MNTYNQLLNISDTKGAAYLVLLDPDNLHEDKLALFVRHCEKSGVDGFLVGGSLLVNGDLESFLISLKSITSLPIIIFPGDVNQVSPQADAILYLSVVSGRNPEHLIGKHVLAAPIIKKCGIEPIATGYLLIESGRTTTAQYMSGSLPIPRNKPGIAAATALAAEYLGMKLIYLEAGSGADYPVPNEMVKAVSELCTVPVVVGGGIKSPEVARQKVQNGARIIVTGNFFENESNWYLISEFADAIHVRIPLPV